MQQETHVVSEDRQKLAIVSGGESSSDGKADGFDIKAIGQ